MKQLYIEDKPTTIFFEKNVKIKNIVSWIYKKLLYSDNIFNLNEQHSCNVHNIDDHTIVISGDEDYKELYIHNVETVSITPH